jgi:3alpha(or 20beta)-hydroxysteroid dehydrogenase
MKKLDGRVAIITGGARGMGSATAGRFVHEGATVFITDVLDDEGAAVAKGLGDAASYHHLDVSDENAWEELVKTITGKYDHIDVLVNNAAIYFYALIEETKSDAFRRLLDINLMGPYLGIKAVLPSMKKNRKGSIINVSSTDGFRGSCGMGAYNASKWGLRGFTKCIAMEAGPFGVRVNSVHPGTVNTPMFNPTGEPLSEVNKRFPGIALSRVADPDEIASVNLFLASDDASYVSGAEIAVDGAWTCGVYLVNKPKP